MSTNDVSSRRNICYWTCSLGAWMGIACELFPLGPHLQRGTTLEQWTSPKHNYVSESEVPKKNDDESMTTNVCIVPCLVEPNRDCRFWTSIWTLYQSFFRNILDQEQWLQQQRNSPSMEKNADDQTSFGSMTSWMNIKDKSLCWEAYITG